MANGHLAIAIPPNPEVARTVLARGRRLARHLGLDWIALFVARSGRASRAVSTLTDLVTALGGEFLSAQSDDIASALVELSLRQRAQVLVIGASRRPRLLRRLVRGTTEQILEAKRPFDVVIAREGADP